MTSAKTHSQLISNLQIACSRNIVHLLQVKTQIIPAKSGPVAKSQTVFPTGIPGLPRFLPCFCSNSTLLKPKQVRGGWCSEIPHTSVNRSNSDHKLSQERG